MAKLPDMLSVSQINRFMSCPLSYKFQYIDGIITGLKSSSLALGTAFHTAAQRLHQDIMNGCIGEAQTYSDACASALDTEFGCYDVVMKPNEDEHTLKAAGGGLVDIYYQHRLANPAKLLACEQKLQCALMNTETGEALEVPFVGYVDLLEEGQDGTVLVDLKTACRSYNQTDIDDNIQLTAYAMMLSQESSGIPQCRIDAIIRNKTPKVQTLHTSRTQGDFLRFFHLARGVWRSISLATAHDTFYPNRGWMCPTCEFAEECRLWGG